MMMRMTVIVMIMVVVVLLLLVCVICAFHNDNWHNLSTHFLSDSVLGTKNLHLIFFSRESFVEGTNYPSFNYPGFVQELEMP